MDTQQIPFTYEQDSGRVFRLRRSAGASTVALFVGGGIAIGAALIGFLVALFLHVDQIAMQGMTTLPLLIGIGALTAGWRSAHAPTEVTLEGSGMLVVTSKGTQSFRWESLGWATVQPVILSSHRQLIVFDSAGKTAFRLPDALEDFDTLAEMIKGRLAANPGGTATRVQMSKARRNAVFMLIAGPAFVALGIANVFMARGEANAARLLAEQAKPGTGRILRRFVAPNGVTKRIEYEVRSPNGRTGTHNAEVDTDYWDSLAGVSTVPVMCVPEDPGISRLAQGEIEDKGLSTNPGVMYILSAIIMCLGLFAVVAGVLALRGWDIDLDSKTGKLSIKRFGTGR